MKKILAFGLLLIAAKMNAQKTFTYTSGKVFEIREFDRQIPYDSIFVIEKENAGWLIPDTSHMRSIYNSFFTDKNVRQVLVGNGPATRQEFDMAGGIFFTSTKDGDVLLQVRMVPGISRQRYFKIDYADSTAMNGGSKFYKLILIRPLL